MTHTPFGGASSRLDHELAAFAANLDVASFKALSPGIGIGEPRAVLQRAPEAATKAFARDPAMTQPMPQGLQRNVPSAAIPRVGPVTNAAMPSPVNKGLWARRRAKKMAKRAQAEMKTQAAAAMRAERRGGGSDAAEGGGPVAMARHADHGSHAMEAHAAYGQGARAPTPPGRRLPFEQRLVAWSIDFLFVLTSIAMALAVATMLSAVRKGDGSDWLSQAPLQWLAQFKALELLAGVYGAFVAYFLLFKLLAGFSIGETLMGAKRVQASDSRTKPAVSPAP